MKKLITLFITIIVVITSCKKELPSPTIKPASFKNVLILGNSITYAPGTPGTEWNNNWGMAASSADKDYVHLLIQHFISIDSATTVTAKNIADFEMYYKTYDDYELEKVVESKPDLVIIRIGEDVDQESFDAKQFDASYSQLLSYITQYNPKCQILAVGSFWGAPMVDAVMQKHSPFISLQAIGSDFTNRSIYLFASTAIQQHPNDKGMQMISDAIWSKVKEMKPPIKE